MENCPKKTICWLVLLPILTVWTVAAAAAGADTPIRSSPDSLLDCRQHIRDNYPDELSKFDREFGAKPADWHKAPFEAVPTDLKAEDLQRFLEKMNPGLDKALFANIASLYQKWGETYGIRWDYAFYQMLHETRYLTFTGGVQKGDYNYGGVGATVEGEAGSKFKDGSSYAGRNFETIEPGVIAHFQHLGNYTLLTMAADEFVTERADTQSKKDCGNPTKRFLCECIDREGSYSACTKNWIMRRVCLERTDSVRVGTWEQLSTIYANYEGVLDVEYFDKMLKKKKEFGKFLTCEEYAEAAAAANDRNTAQGCGFTSPADRWHSDQDAHVELCMKKPDDWRAQEETARFAALQSCAPTDRECGDEKLASLIDGKLASAIDAALDCKRPDEIKELAQKARDAITSLPQCSGKRGVLDRLSRLDVIERGYDHCPSDTDRPDLLYFVLNVKGAGLTPNWAPGSWKVQGEQDVVLAIERNQLRIKAVLEYRRGLKNYEGLCRQTSPSVFGPKGFPWYWTSGPFTATRGTKTFKARSEIENLLRTFDSVGSDERTLVDIKKMAGCG